MPLPLTASTSTTTVTIPALPVALDVLAKGAVVEARVIAGQDSGMVRLAVTVGDTTLDVNAKLPMPLPSGTEVSLRALQATTQGDSATFRLIAVNGKPLSLAVADPMLGTRNSATSVATVAADGKPGISGASMGSEGIGATSTIGVGKPIQAVVLRSDVLQDSQGKSDLMNAGTRLTVRLTRIVLPQVGNGNARAGGSISPSSLTSSVGGQVTTPNTAGEGATVVVGQAAAKYAAMGKISGVQTPATSQVAGATPGVGGMASPTSVPMGSPPSSGQTTLPSGQASQPQASSASLPTGAPAASSQATHIGALTGTVVGHSAVGQPTIQTPNGLMSLDVRAPLPNGTQVTLNVLSSTPPQSSGVAFGTGTPVLGQASPWTTLDALWQTIGQSDPQAAARLVAGLPQPGPHMLANLASAMAAVRAGDVQGWLKFPDSDGRSATKASGRIGKLTEQLAEDVREASQSTRKPAGEWRAYTLPFFPGGGAIDRIQMLVRRAPNQEDEEAQAERRIRAASDIRFLLDVTLSRLGEMQLDGLVNDKARSLDLMIRSRQNLPDTLPKELLGLFTSSLSAVGYTGSLNFRVTSQFIAPDDVIAGDANIASSVEV